MRALCGDLHLPDLLLLSKHLDAHYPNTYRLAATLGTHVPMGWRVDLNVDPVSCVYNKSLFLSVVLVIIIT